MLIGTYNEPLHTKNGTNTAEAVLIAPSFSFSLLQWCPIHPTRTRLSAGSLIVESDTPSRPSIWPPLPRRRPHGAVGPVSLDCARPRLSRRAWHRPSDWRMGNLRRRPRGHPRGRPHLAQQPHSDDAALRLQDHLRHARDIRPRAHRHPHGPGECGSNSLMVSGSDFSSDSGLGPGQGKGVD